MFYGDTQLVSATFPDEDPEKGAFYMGVLEEFVSMNNERLTDPQSLMIPNSLREYFRLWKSGQSGKFYDTLSKIMRYNRASSLGKHCGFIACVPVGWRLVVEQLVLF
jgi:hypothetical protein